MNTLTVSEPQKVSRSAWFLAKAWMYGVMRTYMQKRAIRLLEKERKTKYLRMEFTKDNLRYVFFQKKGAEFTLRFDPVPVPAHIEEEQVVVNKQIIFNEIEGPEKRPKSRLFSYLGNEGDIVYILRSSGVIIKRITAETFFKQKHNNQIGLLTMGTVTEISHTITAPEALSGSREFRTLPAISQKLEDGKVISVASDFVPAHQ